MRSEAQEQISIFANSEQGVAQAAAIIASGGIGAFPTETVYGLGADATNPAAVARIYQAKGRPGDNPLILHVAAKEDFLQLADNPPSYAHALIDAFWPGPLTLVTKKKPGLPAWLGGHPKGAPDTIGIRMPSHPAALAVIKASGCFIAAPSANKAGTPSPTRADHVAADFSCEDIDFILDGGAVPGGLESTVVDVTGDLPVILRPGAVTPKMIAEVMGLEISATDESQPGVIPGPAPDLIRDQARNGAEPSPHLSTASPPRSPGMKYRHYAPKAPMTLLMGAGDDIAEYIKTQCASRQNQRIGIMVTAQTESKLDPGIASSNLTSVLTLGDKAETIAHNLYACLRQFDIIGVDIIYAEGSTQEGLGLAIMDRMKKAAEGRVVNV